MTIVVPRARFTSARKSRTRALATTSRPIVGYVEEEISGRCSSAAISSSFIRSPSGELADLDAEQVADVEHRRRCSSTLSRNSASARPYMSLLEQEGVHRRPSHQSIVFWPSPSEMRRRYSTSRRDGVKPSTSRRPAVGWRSPVEHLSVVVFPAPFGPEARRPAGSDGQVDRVDGEAGLGLAADEAAEGGEQAGTLAMEGVGLGE